MTTLPTQDRIAQEMYEAVERQRRGQIRDYLGMSAIGKPCDRALWMQFRQFTPVVPEGRVLMLFDLGNLIEEQIIKALRLAGYKVEDRDPATDRQWGFQAHGGLFRGHCDGVVHGITRRAHILECKSANAAKFDAFKRFGVQATYPEYYCQAQCYMGYSGLERALFVVANKNTSELYTERVRFNPDDFEALHARAAAIISANAMPTRAFKQGSQECRFCDLRIHCWSPESAIQEHHTCGSCTFLSFEGIKPHCRKPEHPFAIETWGIGCDDWLFCAEAPF